MPELDPELDLELDEAFVETAKTESCWARLSLWHLGQAGLVLPITRASNL
jgi:hypothetical protein